MNPWLIRALWALAGTVIGTIIGESGSEEARVKAKAEGFKDGCKKGESAVIARFTTLMTEARKRDEYLIALVALGYAAAGCDGEITGAEKDELAHYLDSMLNLSGLPPALKIEILAIKEKLTGTGSCRDGFEDITNKLDKIDAADLPSFTKVVQDIIDADGEPTLQECVFMTKWKSYCKGRTDQDNGADDVDERYASRVDEL